ncbi:squalene cyclase [Methanohalophilus levihalophilus]|uniref:prenyltransferase/squalene oxidase repeat-containing protein n=1 Tax=Methanohalophilus levihalophilus TaxID=1431282 RepID=UPI001AE8021B|nr:prenyltransferase/squalene oxidase repeat-containing protein [Methanohalophilus levihalophilus]MBP2030202.1 squalene cyclase [Methanohalophilus levihalophilus]
MRWTIVTEIEDAAKKGFIWLEQQHPDDLKEISRFSLAYTLWKKENKWIDFLNNVLQEPLKQNVRDIARVLTSASIAGTKFSESEIWIKEQQNQNGSWGTDDIYDTAYALTALANAGYYNPIGCNWLLDNFSSGWEHPGTISLIITALVKQGKTGNTNIYNDFISQRVQWLLDNEDVKGGWKYIATTTIVIDALINSGHNDAINPSAEWLVGRQNPDGSWGKGEKRKNTTAMVLACFAKIQ